MNYQILKMIWGEPKHDKPKSALSVTEDRIGKWIKNIQHRRTHKFILLKIKDGICECENLDGASYSLRIEDCYYTNG